MLDQDQGRRPCVADGGEPIEECVGAGRVEVGGRLVQHDHPGEWREDPGQRQPLLLAAGEAPRPTPSEAAETDLVERVGDPRAHAVDGPAPVLEPERDVVLDPLHDELRGRVLEHQARPGPRAPVRSIDPISTSSIESEPVTVAGTSRGIRPAIARASVLLPDPDGPTTRRHPPGGEVERDPVERGAVGASIRDGQVAGDDPTGDLRDELGSQSGNPSSTPDRFSARWSATEPPATSTTAEIAIRTPRTSWTPMSTSA